jgi:hypothetical protein
VSEDPLFADSSYRACPACGEPIRKEAVICRFDLRTNTFFGQPPPAAAPTATVAPRTNSYAVASLVLGIVNMLVGSILALVFGYRAVREIDDSNGTQAGRGLAVAGIVLGWVGLVMGIIWVVVLVTVVVPNWGSPGFIQ